MTERIYTVVAFGKVSISYRDISKARKHLRVHRKVSPYAHTRLTNSGNTLIYQKGGKWQTAFDIVESWLDS